jgi:DNA-binding transcriptional ArsR family regulator
MIRGVRKPKDMPESLWEHNGHGPVSQVSPSLNAGVTPVTPLRFSEMEPPGPREYVVEGIMPRGHTTSLFGDGGSAKSILALSAGTAISGGAEEWLGRKVHNSPVLYADFELDADEQRRRAYQVACGVYLEKPPYDLLYVSGLGRHAGEVLKECLAICASEGVGLVIVDSLGIALQGDAESARDVITFHHRYLDSFRVSGVTLLVVDHQGKTQAGERYQNKRSFGSVYKENLARSVIQVEPGDRGEGLLTVKLRQTKHNFGSKAEPFGARLTFTEEIITVDAHTLDAIDLAEEVVLNSRDRVMLALKGGPAYPSDIAETCHMPLGTVKNELTRLRKRGLVEYTGEVQGQARQVRLTEDGRSVTGVTATLKDCDAVTPDKDATLGSVRVNDRGEAEF